MSKKMFTAIFALAVVAVSVWYANLVEAQIVTDGLISFWTFDKSDVEDAIAKDVVGINDATINGDPQMVDGKIEEALEFDGVDDCVDCGVDASLSLTGAITLEAWVKWTGGDNPYFVTKTGDGSHRSYDLSGNSDGTVEFRMGGADCGSIKSTGTIAVPTDKWIHLVGTYEPSGHVRLFIDGSLAKEETSGVPASQCDNGLHWYIAAREGNQGFFGGALDEVKIYNRALSADEVRRNYTATSQLAVVKPMDKLAITWGKIKAKG